MAIFSKEKKMRARLNPFSAVRYFGELMLAEQEMML
jgi:hypothetical protein